MAAIDTFFAAWGEADGSRRAAMIAEAMAESFTYSDPRSPGEITSLDGLTEYVAMFSANAPGWTAKVVSSDTVNATTRAVVAFGGKGPDGSDMVQHGTYFAVDDGGKITLLAGFVGLGSAE